MTDSDLPPAIRQEVDRQVDAIMRGTAFGDGETRRTMQAELRDRLASALQNDKPLRVYLGVDPTAPAPHLGHCVSLRKPKLFQELGHHAILLIGAFPGLIAGGLTSAALDVWPLNIFPSFLVPAFIILQIIVLMKVRHLRRASRQTANAQLQAA